LTTVTLDFLPKGGLVSTTSKWSRVGLVAQGVVGLDRGLAARRRRADAVQERFMAHRRATPSTSSTPCRAL
jgi:hypothetical protein